MKKVMAIGIVALMALMAIPLIAGNVAAKTDVYTYDGWTHTQDYSGWGPYHYYGEDVRVVYTAFNRWTINIKNGNIREHLKQTGTAEIYSLVTGDLLDTRPFVCTEKSFDEGRDAGYWDGTWYNVVGSFWNPILEDFDYSWKIPGVYHFQCLKKDGVVLKYEYTVPGIIDYSWI